MTVLELNGLLPIEEYDGLRVTEILPRLVGLSSVQLGAILRHELAHKARCTVIERVEVLLREAAAASVPLPRRPVDDVDEAADPDAYATYDPRLWRRLLVDASAKPDDVNRRSWWRRSA